jgi:adenylylsulfate kinase
MDKSHRSIQRHSSKVTSLERQHLNAHKSCVVWFTGLSASGKSSLAYEVEHLLLYENIHAYVLDGDNLRHGLNKDLGFSPDDRSENIRRSAEVAKLFVDAGTVTLLAMISPFRCDRDYARSLFQSHEFIEVYMDCPLAICEQRDPKGLYKKARSGDLQGFTGVSALYEPPLNPEIVISSNLQSLEDSAKKIINYLVIHAYLHI